LVKAAQDKHPHPASFLYLTAPPFAFDGVVAAIVTEFAEKLLKNPAFTLRQAQGERVGG
jgi:hypothetical protein